MRHIIKGLDVILDFDSVRKCFNSIFVLVHGREQAIWNRNGSSVLEVYHCRMSGRSRANGLPADAAKVVT